MTGHPTSEKGTPSTHWDPDQYLRFERLRTRPAVDLARGVELEAPESILDIGCGPGNSTRVLWERWPRADITGLDSSREMIARARSEHPTRPWIHTDVRDLSAEPRYDLVFSNAAIQWIPEHETLFPRLLALVNAGGALAVQIPLYHEMPVSHAVASVSKRQPWSDIMAGCDSELTWHGMDFYYDLLSPSVREMRLWQTWYVHEMDSHSRIVEMMRSTGMRCFLERLTSAPDRRRFESEVLEALRAGYSEQGNGKVLFPFRRLFLVASA